jgi:hypothetical protein
MRLLTRQARRLPCATTSKIWWYRRTSFLYVYQRVSHWLKSKHCETNIFQSSVYIYNIYIYIIHLLYPICWYLKHGESPLFEEYRHVPASWQPGYSLSRPPFADFDGRNTPIKNGNVEAKIAVELGKKLQHIWENMGWTPKVYENMSLK